MKKRVLSIIMGALLLVGLTGCQKVSDMVGGTATGADTKMYQDISSIMGDPDKLDNSTGKEYLQKDITFTAYILNDPEALELEGTTKQYISAVIARNSKDYMLINVDDLDEVPAAGSYATVSGSMNGYIYYTADNQNVKIVDLKAKKITAKETEDNPSTENKVSIDDGLTKGSIVFKEAEFTKDNFGRDAVLLYFEYTNEDNRDEVPAINTITFRQGDTYLGSNSYRVEAEIDPGALDTLATNTTPQGKTSLYYTVLYPLDSEVTLTSDSVTANYYDDDFNCLNEVEIAVK